MNIVQVVTLISDDGAFGGPSRVAQAQCAALADLGHNVTLLAAGRLEAANYSRQEGYLQILFPARSIHPRLGFAGLYARGMQSHLSNILASVDVAHIHLARDLVTLPAALKIRRSRTPYVLQPHGMIDHSTHPLAAPLDTLWTKPLLRESTAVLTLTEREEQDIEDVASGTHTIRVKNGVSKRPAMPMTSHTHRSDRSQRVLFLARLHERKRPLAFVAMAAEIVKQRPNVRFVLAGPDEGQASEVRAAIDEAGLTGVIEMAGPILPAATDDLLASADVYVLPSYNEVFPMTVLEAMRLGVPTVVTDSLGIVDACRTHRAAAISDGTPEDLANHVLRILDEPSFRDEIVRGGYAYIDDELGIEAVARRLESIYLRTASGVI